jgi:hypothetical protein
MNKVELCIEAQEKYCTENNIPLFAPSDGECFDCDKQIYNKITLEEAGSKHITGCPYCAYSYCE